MLAVKVIILIAALVITVIYPCFIVSSKCSREEEKREEFKGYLYCDDDCYMCWKLEECKKAVKKEG